MDKSDIQELIGQLGSRDRKLQEKALKEVSKKGESIIPILIDSLKDKNDILRSNASYALEIIAENHPEYSWKEAVPALIEAFNDEKTETCAYYALADIGEPAIPALVDALKNGNKNERTQAVWTFWMMEQKKKADCSPAVPALIDASKEKDYGLQSKATEALAEIGDPSTINHLISTLKCRYDGPRQAAVNGLINIGDPAIPALLDAYKSKDLDGQSTVAWIFGKIGNIENSKTIVPFLISAFRDKDRRMQHAVINAFGEIAEKGVDCSAAVPLLMEALKGCGESGRKDIAITLSRIGEKRAVPLLIEILKNDKPDVHWEGLEILNKILEKSIKEKNHPTALMILKALALEIMERYKGSKDIRSLHQRRKELSKLESLTQEIHDKMNPEKKTFHVPHQPVRAVRKKVISNG